ncbi:MAG: RNA pseudouridine synthase [Campylobacterota bacterium]|nr:RNA pseudouridine synthase [Campylobacterota bacterium]
MSKEKAYKVLALQEGISNTKAKDLIDRGLVYSNNKKVMIARGEIDKKTKFTVTVVEKAKPIFKDKNIIVVNKPAFVNSDEIEKQFDGAVLLHRLDRETSGVLMLVKNEEFRLKAIEEFRADRVYKEYSAWVDGMVIDDYDIDKPIITEKRGGKAHSKISKSGKPARTEVFADEVNGKKSKLKIIIHNGRTHQIRTHLRSIGFPIIGDELYGGKRYTRVMLHAKKVKLLNYEFVAPEPREFAHFSS